MTVSLTYFWEHLKGQFTLIKKTFSFLSTSNNVDSSGFICLDFAPLAVCELTLYHEAPYSVFYDKKIDTTVSVKAVMCIRVNLAEEMWWMCNPLKI